MNASHRTSLRYSVLACLLTAAGLVLAPHSARAQDAPGLTAPAGQQVAQFAWSGEASLIAVTYSDSGYGVYRVELADGQWLPVSMPPSFSRLKPTGKQFSGKAQAVDFVLSPDGTGLAVLEHAPQPLTAPTLSVYRWTASGYRGVDTRALPQGFWPSRLAWDSQGQQLYIAAREYLFPDQLYSIGALDSTTGQFTGVMLKGNIDLVDELVYLPQRQALAVRCRGYQGEYPEQSVIALVDLAARQFSILHSEADGHQLLALANGELVVLEPESEQNTSAWVLTPGARQLSKAELMKGSIALSLRVSQDGKWLGYLEPTEAGGSASGLILQMVQGGKQLTTSESCGQFAFSLDSRYVCAVDASQTRLFFFQLPD